MKRPGVAACFLCVFLTIFSFPANTADLKSTEEETLSIYFNDEKVGYEEYVWTSSQDGYCLSGKGRIEKPVPITIDLIEIHLDGSYIPLRYTFKGTISGVYQEIQSEFREGEGANQITVAGQSQEYQVNIRRDAFLLPNPLFSPYVVITKKFGCSVSEALELSAYTIPQLETPFLLEAKEEDPCTLLMTLSSIQIEIQTNEEGDLVSIVISSQGLRVVRD